VGMTAPNRACGHVTHDESVTWNKRQLSEIEGNQVAAGFCSRREWNKTRAALEKLGMFEVLQFPAPRAIGLTSLRTLYVPKPWRSNTSLDPKWQRVER
jgi:hypothetical protein